MFCTCSRHAKGKHPLALSRTPGTKSIPALALR
jgi:hypothetical protein